MAETTQTLAPPETRYARSGDVSIAYQVLGEGPFDLVLVPGAVTNLELVWDNERRAAAYRRLASRCRLILFDKRGTGLSDRVAGPAGVETRMDDVRAVMDAAGSARAALVGIGEGGPISLVFAATYPERAFAVALVGSAPRYVWAPDYPWAPTPEACEAAVLELERRWGTRELAEELFARWAPSLADDPDARRAFERVTRTGASPGAAAALYRMNMAIDVRALLPEIRTPTLVLHRTGQEPDVRGARYMAERLPAARLVELPGRDASPFAADHDRVVGELLGFVEAAWEAAQGDHAEPDRVLATILFTDIVDSTVRAFELGDAAWRALLAEHHALVRGLLARFRGRELDTAGDGFLASFDGPARAIRCACAIVDGVRSLGLEVRAGLHTGEFELVDGKLAGVAVHIGARVAARADGGQVLVSRTVRDLVAGSGIEFGEGEAAELKGVPGEWRLYPVSR